MRKFLTFVLVFSLAIGLGYGAVIADKPTDDDGNYLGNGTPSGKHFQFNIIGHPKNADAISGDDSNGRAIMIPLKNTPGQGEIVCEADQIALVDDLSPTFQNSAPTGAKIHFLPGDHYEIVDRDATDSNGATIMVKTFTEEDPNSWGDGDGNPDKIIAFDIYMRVLGKPMTCMDIDGYAFDADQGLWFWSGRVDLNRKAGKSTFLRVNELFWVNFCWESTTSGQCDGGSAEISVFDNVFEGYFWNILNKGTRLVQVRLYPVASPQ